MANERYVVLGLARPRSPWSRDVGQWATAAALPIEYIRCVSADEVRARLTSGRQFSALLVDGRVGGVDRDLLASARQQNCAVLVVTDDRVPRDWAAIGASTTLDPRFGRDDLRAELEGQATPIDDAATVDHPTTERSPGAWRGPLVVVLGPGGAGSSTVAMALAQGAADDARHGGRVVLADLCLDADLALLHDAREMIPGLPELVEAHRLGQPAPSEIEALTFGLADRSYRLLLGLRRHRDWITLRPGAVRAAIESLRTTFHLVVADTDADLEGEPECGSLDVEERNLLARTSVHQADVVVLVGTAGLTGLHGLVRALGLALDAGVAPDRLITVVNRAPKAPRARAELTHILAGLAPATVRNDLSSPIYLPGRRRLDELHRDVRRLPAALTGPVTGAVEAVLDRAVVDRSPVAANPVPIEAGSLGTWTDP